MIAASVIVAMQISVLLSYRVWARLQPLSLANMFSTLWRCLYCVLQKGAGELRRFVANHSVKPRVTDRPRTHLGLSGRRGLRLCLDLGLGHDLVPGPVRWLETLHISGDNLHLRQDRVADHSEIILHRRMAFEPGPVYQIPPRTRKRA